MWKNYTRDFWAVFLYPLLFLFSYYIPNKTTYNKTTTQHRTKTAFDLTRWIVQSVLIADSKMNISTGVPRNGGVREYVW